jgi:hypothetical protein
MTHLRDYTAIHTALPPLFGVASILELCLLMNYHTGLKQLRQV